MKQPRQIKKKKKGAYRKQSVTTKNVKIHNVVFKKYMCLRGLFLEHPA